jgi:hypothetical protein
MQSSTGLDGLKKKALVLVWIGEIECVRGRSSLMVWNWSRPRCSDWCWFDSILELAAGGILIWRLQTKWEDRDEESSGERKAHKLVGITFLYWPSIP